MASIVSFRPALACRLSALLSWPGIVWHLVEALAEARLRELTRRELGRLDDRMLRDIGIEPDSRQRPLEPLRGRPPPRLNSSPFAREGHAEVVG
jgi:uncharacterized protein YjiS (DUF1127 family)